MGIRQLITGGSTSVFNHGMRPPKPPMRHPVSRQTFVLASCATGKGGWNRHGKIPQTGALGCAQLMREKALHVICRRGTPTDPYQNLDGGRGTQACSYGRLARGICAAAYNAGPGCGQKIQCVPPYAETKKLCEGHCRPLTGTTKFLTSIT